MITSMTPKYELKFITSFFIDIKSFDEPCLKGFELIYDLQGFINALMEKLDADDWNIRVTTRDYPMRGFARLTMSKNERELFSFNPIEGYLDNNSTVDYESLCELCDQNFHILDELYIRTQKDDSDDDAESDQSGSQ
jgi:hypothetical protein